LGDKYLAILSSSGEIKIYLALREDNFYLSDIANLNNIQNIPGDVIRSSDEYYLLDYDRFSLEIEASLLDMQPNEIILSHNSFLRKYITNKGIYHRDLTELIISNTSSLIMKGFSGNKEKYFGMSKPTENLIINKKNNLSSKVTNYVTIWNPFLQNYCMKLLDIYR
jgi:hypothetical protein